MHLGNLFLTAVKLCVMTQQFANSSQMNDILRNSIQVKAKLSLCSTKYHPTKTHSSHN